MQSQRMQAHGIVSSMGGAGNCNEGPVQESSFGLLKRERVNRRQNRTRAKAWADVLDFIEDSYNGQRTHSFAQGLAHRNF